MIEQINVICGIIVDGDKIYCEKPKKDNIFDLWSFISAPVFDFEQRFEVLKEKLNNKKEELKNLEEQNDLISNDINTLKQQIASLQGSITSYVSQVVYAEEIVELKAALEDYKFVIEEMENAIKSFIDGQNTANEELQKVAGKYEESMKQLDEAKLSHASITDNYFKLINELNLSQDVIDDFEEYINELSNRVTYTKTVTEFETNYINTSKIIEELEIKLAEKQKENIEYLVKEIDLLNKEIELLNLKINDLDKLLSYNTQINKDLEKTFKLYISTCDEYNEINELNKTANGNNPKYISFERFVLIEYDDSTIYDGYPYNLVVDEENWIIFVFAVVGIAISVVFCYNSIYQKSKRSTLS